MIVVAGDLGHYNAQSLEAMLLIKERYCRELVCVLGNHDYYMSQKERQFYSGSFERAEAMKRMLAENGIHCMDGTIVEIDGIRFGGAMGWYDGMYAWEHFQRQLQGTLVPLEEYWRKSMNDFAQITDIKHVRDLWEIEKPKIEAVYRDCDIMVTHVNPSIKKEHTDSQWRGNMGTAFFTFDGRRYMQGGSMKHWIFGHTHSAIEYKVDGVEVHSCQLGYPGETSKSDLPKAARLDL